ncbi:unnamed protein product [Phytophthora fragariaefolia]|uniref:Unnamed protein product n=1 Tax=Phytophthora fragariaefolia TaxID=1490495 RepID=A0A9W6YBQ8_9STRA|nr:unnamed protein product [Phytophthora fragariaefolia]
MSSTSNSGVDSAGSERAKSALTQSASSVVAALGFADISAHAPQVSAFPSCLSVAGAQAVLPMTIATSPGALSRVEEDLDAAPSAFPAVTKPAINSNCVADAVRSGKSRKAGKTTIVHDTSHDTRISPRFWTCYNGKPYGDS